MIIDHNFYMQLALNEAWKYQLQTYPNPSVGAVVVKNGAILSIEAHKEAGKPHAEVNAIKEAFLKYFPDSPIKKLDDSFEIHTFLLKNHDRIFEDCTIYVTLEPCNHIGKTPACSNLIKELHFKEVIIGTRDPNNIASGGIEYLKKSNIDVTIGILEKKCKDLLYPFTIWQKKQFIFFKMAQRLDGSVHGGKISSQKSLEWVHSLRTKIDCLLIGGETVRTDRPTLDSRYVNGNAADVFIYTRMKEFDATIPLFSVKNRKVNIGNDLSLVQNKQFIMVEGGYNFLELLKDKIDMIVIILSAKIYQQIKNNIIYLEYEILFQYFNDEDIIIYLKIKK